VTRGGVEEEFEAWYLREHGRVVSTVAAVTGRPSIAGECADEAFTRACERWASVRGMASPGGWVTTVALNEARRRLRRAGHERRLLVWVASTAPVEAPPPAWSPEVWEALAALPRREREAVALRYVADLPVGRIATIMGVAPGTAASTLHSARARLARVLAPVDADAEESADACR
jgi:RNA polymerase sigma-70 factor (ECF subfamily)